MRRLSRRQALALLASLAGAAAVPIPVRGLLAGTLPDPLARYGALDRRAAARLGRDYLARYPAEGEGLLDRILGDAGADRDLAALIHERVRRDFEAGRVLVLRDWQVARTEGRIFAAVALTD